MIKRDFSFAERFALPEDARPKGPVAVTPPDDFTTVDEFSTWSHKKDGHCVHVVRNRVPKDRAPDGEFGVEVVYTDKPTMEEPHWMSVAVLVKEFEPVQSAESVLECVRMDVMKA